VGTHAGVMRRLLTLWLDLPPEAGWRLHLPNASFAVVRFTGEDASLAELRPPAEYGGADLPRRGGCGTMLGTSSRE
jgi:broad specificity phosphatase PhoE